MQKSIDKNIQIELELDWDIVIFFPANIKCQSILKQNRIVK